MRLLLAEDDGMIGSALVTGLADAGYTVDWVRDAPAAALALRDVGAHYVGAIIDLGLARGDGLDVIKEVRRRSIAVPILVVTARDAVDDRVRGLDAGADDYLVKPFALAELLARLRSISRRPAGRAGNTLSAAGLALDPVERKATIEGRTVSLGVREFALLYALMDRPGTVLSRSQIEERVYGWDNGVESNAVEVLIHGVRRKFGKDVIENVRGVGWRIGTGA